MERPSHPLGPKYRDPLLHLRVASSRNTRASRAGEIQSAIPPWAVCESHSNPGNYFWDTHSLVEHPGCHRTHGQRWRHPKYKGLVQFEHVVRGVCLAAATLTSRSRCCSPSLQSVSYSICVTAYNLYCWRHGRRIFIEAASLTTRI